MKTLKIIRDIAAILALLSVVVLVVYFVMQGNKDATITAVIFGLFFGALRADITTHGLNITIAAEKRSRFDVISSFL